MSIFKGTQLEVDRKEQTGSFLFNTNRIAELTADGSDSQMLYTKNFLDPRNPAHEYKLDETNAAITALAGGDDSIISLPVLKKKVNGVTSTFAKTVAIGADKIAYGWADPDDASKSWLECYPNGFKKVVYQVNLSLAQLDGVAQFFTFAFLNAPNAALSADVTGTINYAAKTIAATVPAATVVTALVASFTASSNSVVKVSTTTQVSGVTANNFTSAVSYLVSGTNGVTTTWVVTVTIAS